MNNELPRSRIIDLFLQGNLDVIVSDRNYKSFLEEISSMEPRLRWCNGLNAVKWAPYHEEYLHRISMNVFPRHRYLSSCIYTPEEDSDPFPIVFWGEVE